MIQIRFPIWNTRSIGIAESRLVPGENLVEILYTDKSGKRVYPNTYSVSRERMLECPVQFTKGVKLRIIPISELTVSGGGQTWWEKTKKPSKSVV